MRKTLLLGSILVAGLGTAACSRDSGNSPLSPSPVASGARATTIKGTVNAATTPQSTGQLAAHASGTLEVCVVGTDICVEVDASGDFAVSGHLEGTVQLRFRGSDPDVDIEVKIHGVELGETITVTVDLDGATHTETREGGDHASDENTSDHNSSDEDEDTSDHDSPDEEGHDGSHGGKGSQKVKLCHRTGSGRDHEIEVSVNAESAHRGHGDGAVGDRVPDDSTKVFDEDCRRAAFGVAIEKSTNDQDADGAPGPSIPVGDPVTWEYVVTNTGDVELIDVTVVDDQAVAVDCGGQTTLAAGDSMTCTATGLAVEGPYENLGTVTAGSNGAASTSDSDSSHYLCGVPSVAIEKSTNVQDADVAPGPSISVGDPVTWEYVVTNTGDVELIDVTVVDDQGVAVDCGEQTTLAPGDSMTCTATGTAVEGQYENVGMVTSQAHS